MQTDVWTYRQEAGVTASTVNDIIGFNVEAIDGSIGKVDNATAETGTSYIVVDTGPWIFGKKVMLPAGVIQNVDMTDERIFVNRTKDEIKNAPEFDENLVGDDAYHGELGSYYGPGGRAHRQFDDSL
jgi:hypothetical protein